MRLEILVLNIEHNQSVHYARTATIILQIDKRNSRQLVNRRGVLQMLGQL